MAAADMSSKRIVESCIRSRIARLEEAPLSPQADLPFIVADSTNVLLQHHRWRRLLPQIRPFYAVKCNPDVRLLQLLADLGLGFDCASAGEIQTVLDLGVEPSRIVFSHPCKSVSGLHMASRRGVLLATFDNADELDKIKDTSPEMHLLLRIYAKDDTAKVCLGKKFGAPLDTTESLLLRARELGLDVVGVNFHIGSAASDPRAFTTSVRHAREVFDQGKSMGFDMTILDVGGGFQDANFEAMALSLRRATQQAFSEDVHIIAEPGRFYARSFYTMACKVIARRQHFGSDAASRVDMLYQNDGIYGCFMNKVTEREEFNPTLVSEGGNNGSTNGSGEKYCYSIWGPTCDSLDCVVDKATMDREVRVGDWLKYPNMGAYTIASSTTFNGFPNTYDVIYVSSRLLADRED
ncbi:pyridoxal-dependent decarboxylase [Podospora conica]|nr:pyridoxal-dependent decarboxylase [Schizothecium conicum]